MHCVSVELSSNTDEVEDEAAMKVKLVSLLNVPYMFFNLSVCIVALELSLVR